MVEATTKPTRGPARVAADAGDAATREDETCAGFETFYARERQSIIGLAYVLSGSRSGAEDLAQDAFLAAFRKWERVASYDDPSAWIRRVVANRAISGFRRRRAEAKALLRMRAQTTEIPEIPDDSEAIWQLVRRLPARQAQAIALRYLDRRSITEIARILDCSENTVKTHLKRAKRTLAESLDRENYDENREDYDANT